MFRTEDWKMAWEKLLSPSTYGPEEYLIVSLTIFIILVMIKHLVYHTLYYWWYREGRLHIPMTIQNFLTGKSLPQRLCNYVKLNGAEKCSVSQIMQAIEEYSNDKEFALTLGKEKGAVLDKVVAVRKPQTVLVCNSLCGYSVLRILQASPSCHVYVVEPDLDRCSAIKQIMDLANKNSQVTVIASLPVDAIPKLHWEYKIEKLDFIFLTSTALCEPTHHKVLQSLEESSLFHDVDEPGTEGPCTVILADKVVHFGEGEFLKHVRFSDQYMCEYHQVPLEYSPDDIVDGMEKAVFMGRH